MGLKKIRQNTGECLIKIRIEEDSGALLEKWTIMMSDLGKWFKIMKKKYGNRVETRNDNQDLDWLK